jgi:hypothetical protein
MFFALLSASLFFLLPALIGRAIFQLATRSAHKHAEPLASYFVLGSLSIFGIAAAWQVLPIQFSFAPYFFWTIYLLSGISLIINLILRPKISRTQVQESALPISLSLAIALVVHLLWSIHSPYPLNWDLYEHQTLANLIQQGHWSFFTSRISDSFIFDGYSSLFHTLLSVSQFCLFTNIISFWQAISFWHTTLLVLAAYTLAKLVSRSTSVAILSALLSGFIFESVITFTSLFFLPQTWSAVLAIFLFCQFLQDRPEHHKKNWILLTLSLIGLFLGHYIIGTLGIGIVLFAFLFNTYGKRIEVLIQQFPLVESATLLILLIFFASFILNLSFINHGEAAAYTFSLPLKFEFMKRIYGLLLLFTLPLGFIYAIRQKNKQLNIVLFITLAFLAASMSQFPYALKFYTIGRFFVHLVMALGIWSILQFAHFKVTKAISFSVVGLSLAVILLLNSAYWKNGLSYSNLLTHLTPTELQAATFLKENYQHQNVLMISDPATQNILEALSGVNSAGGAYSSDTNRSLLAQIGVSSQPTQVYDHLFEIKDQVTPEAPVRLLVMSGRYFEWQNRTLKEKASFDFNIWNPSNLSLENWHQVEGLLKDPKFRLVYNNPEIAILEVK